MRERDDPHVGASPPEIMKATIDLIILVGLQAAGKTAFCRDRFAETHVHVSKDLMRNARNREARQRAMVAEALAAGKSVVVDNTNARREDRAELIRIAKSLKARVTGYLLESTIEESLARNARRAGRACVPPVAIRATAKRLRIPSRTEGFDELFRVRLTPSGFQTSPLSEDDIGRHDQSRVQAGSHQHSPLTP